MKIDHTPIYIIDTLSITDKERWANENTLRALNVLFMPV